MKCSFYWLSNMYKCTLNQLTVNNTACLNTTDNYTIARHIYTNSKLFVQSADGHQRKLRLHIIRPLVDFKHDYRYNERYTVETGRDPTVDGVLIVQFLDVWISVIPTSPLVLVNWQIFCQSRCTNFEKDSQQRLHKYEHNKSIFLYKVTFCLIYLT